MQPLDDINPEIINYGTGMGTLEFIGAVVIMVVVGVAFQYIIDSDKGDYR